MVATGAIEYPLAVQCLVHRRYVDDLAPGAQTKEIRAGQEVMCTQILESIGLKLKYIVRSGEVPCERASSGGVSINCWVTNGVLKRILCLLDSQS